MLFDGRTACEATFDWLVAHGFSYDDDEHFFFAHDLLVQGEAAVEYKSAVIEGLTDEGWTTDLAYGNADSDIEAYLQAGIPADHIFLVGRLAETEAESMGVEPLPDDQAYTQHLADYFPSLPAPACD